MANNCKISDRKSVSEELAKITGENNGMFGRHHTEEAKKKMREAKLITISPNRNKNPVICIELN